MSEINQSIESALNLHLDGGVALKECPLTELEYQRTVVALDVWKKLQTDPNLDVRQYLLMVHHRKYSQLVTDMKVVNFLIGKLNQSDRTFDEYRVRKNADKLIRMGEAQADWKAIEAGTRILERVSHAGEPETAADLNKNTANIPIVITADPSSVQEGKIKYSPEEMEQLRRQYHAAKDETMEMIEVKAGEYMSLREVQEIIAKDEASRKIRGKYGLEEEGSASSEYSSEN